MPGATLEIPEQIRPVRASQARSRFALRLLVGMALVLVGGAALLEAGRVVWGNNLHVVVPGRVYRSAQLTPAELARVIREQGIRTVINLRGCGAPWPWYLDEARVTANLDIDQQDICLCPTRLPSTSEIRRLVDVLDHTAYPVLLHCRRGADRTGLASAVAVLLAGQADLARGRQQLGLRFGHMPFGHTQELDGFFDLYESWLKDKRLEHTPTVFRRWLVEGYCPRGYRARLEPIEVPAEVKCGWPAAVRVRCHNEGLETWQFSEEPNRGVHASLTVFDATDRQVASERAGVFDAAVPPGKSIDLVVPLPALRAPGRYRLMVDMVDERQGSFFQFGSEPLERELSARE